MLPAEGEGRNAVYAARLGWKPYAFDISLEGMRKATLLAKRYNVDLHYTVGGYADIEYEPASMDMIAFIFAHVTPEVRGSYYHKILRSLKPGGLVILEGFNKDQMKNDSGGPRNLEMLYDEEQLQADFGGLTSLEIIRNDRYLDEGGFHQGEAALVQMRGYKPQ